MPLIPTRRTGNAHDLPLNEDPLQYISYLDFNGLVDFAEGVVNAANHDLLTASTDSQRLAALQDAFDAAGDGGKIIIPPGDWHINGTIAGSSKQHVYGPGATITQTTNNTPTFKWDSKTDVVVEGLSLVGVGEPDTASTTNAGAYGVSCRAYGLWFENCSRVAVKGCYVRNHKNAGIVAYRPTDYWVIGNRVTGTRGNGPTSADPDIPDQISGYQQFGIWVVSGYPDSHGTTHTGYEVSGRNINLAFNYSAETHHGFYVGPNYEYVNVTNNATDYLGQHSLYTVPFRKLVVANNRFTATLDAVKLQGQWQASYCNPTDFVITGNVLEGGGAPALNLNALDEVSISTPIRASTYIENITVSGNTIKSNGHAAILATGVRNCIIVGNNLRAPRSGIYTYSFDGVIENNTFRECGDASNPPLNVTSSPFLTSLVRGNIIHGISSGTPDAYIATHYNSSVSPPIAWAGSKYHGLKSYCQNDSGKVYVCTTGGISAAGGGPTGTGTGIADGSCVWDYVVDVADVNKGTTIFESNIIIAGPSEPTYSFYLGSTNIIFKGNNSSSSAKSVQTNAPVTLSDDGNNYHAGWVAGSPYLAGPSFGKGRRDFFADAAPTSGAWNKGDRVWNNFPAKGGPAFWICVTAGTPGTWNSVPIYHRYSGTSAPAAGSWALGDVMWNTSPSAGGPAFWICVTAGTPGTWKAVNCEP